MADDHCQKEGELATLATLLKSFGEDIGHIKVSQEAMTDAIVKVAGQKEKIATLERDYDRLRKDVSILYDRVRDNETSIADLKLHVTNEVNRVANAPTKAFGKITLAGLAGLASASGGVIVLVIQSLLKGTGGGGAV